MIEGNFHNKCLTIKLIRTWEIKILRTLQQKQKHINIYPKLK